MSKDEFLSVGGQAIIRGVMMRSPKYFAVACRAPNNDIIVHSEPLEKTWIGRQKWLKVPFLRGTWALLDAMTLGARAMKFASDVQLRDDLAEGMPTTLAPDGTALPKEISSASDVKSPKESVPRLQETVIITTMVLSLAISLAIFKLIPHSIGTWLEKSKSWGPKSVNFSIEMIKLTLFLGYMMLIRRLPEVYSVFRYHGAEHKAINVYERELPLTLENCRAMTRLHPRCGTSFAMIVLILGFFVFTFVPRVMVDAPLIITALSNFALHLAILPLIAGVAYEMLRFAGKFRDNSLVMSMFMPGIWTQYITTAEPDDTETEVAIASLEACLAGERRLS